MSKLEDSPFFKDGKLNVKMKGFTPEEIAAIRKTKEDRKLKREASEQKFNAYPDEKKLEILNHNKITMLKDIADIKKTIVVKNMAIHVLQKSVDKIEILEKEIRDKKINKEISSDGNGIHF